jgi:hypothetical protein
MPSKNSINNEGFQPVPKETGVSQGSGGSPVVTSDATENVSVSSSPMNPQNQVVQQPQNVPPEQVVEVQKVVVEKKGGGCNKTTCCLACCGGCLIFVVVAVLAVIFAGPSVARFLNKVINRGVVVPEVHEVNAQALDLKINTILSKGGEQTVVFSEDEMNTLLKTRVASASNDNTKIDARVKFEKDKTQFFFKMANWMPWAIILIEPTSSGDMSIKSVKIGPVNVTTNVEQFVKNQGLTEGSTSGELDVKGIYSSIIFDDHSDEVKINKIYLYDSEIKLDIVVTKSTL